MNNPEEQNIGGVKILTRQPPNIEAIRARFGDIPKTAVFAYGKTIYNPSGSAIAQPTLVHEITHFAQQALTNPETWWDRYLADPQFRLDQEIEACSNEYNSLREMVRDRNRLNHFLNAIARSLASTQYGNMVGYSQALRLIKNHADQGYSKGRNAQG